MTVAHIRSPAPTPDFLTFPAKKARLSCLKALEFHPRCSNMDPGYICDAKYGPWTFNMIFKDLQETKKALEVLTQVCTLEVFVRLDLIGPTGKGHAQGRPRKMAEPRDI